MFGFGTKGKGDDNVKASVIDATNSESGISALGGISSDSLSTKKVDTASLNNVQKEAISNLFRDDQDYLTIPGSTKQRPRSAVFTHTIGMAVCCGGAVGAATGGVVNFNRQLAADSLARSQFVTMIVRRIRNNAIRFGGFATVMCTTGVVLEMMAREPTAPQPTEDEMMDMHMKGIQYQPPSPKPLDEQTQRWITTLGFIGAAVGMSTPKAYELWRDAGKFESLTKAQADAGLLEQQFMKLYGRRQTVDENRLPGLLRRLAVFKVCGVLFVAIGLDYMWHKQMKDKVTGGIRKFSSSLY